MTTPSKLFAALFLALTVGCGGAIAPESAADAGNPLIAAEAGLAADAPYLPEPVPTPVDDGAGFAPPKPPPSRHPPKAE